MKYISYDSAVATLKDFFSISPDTDIVSLQQIYIATGRDLSKPALNKAWLSNKLTHLKHYQLVSPVYSQGRRRVLDKIQLTADGKKALGRDIEGVGESMADYGPRQISLESIARDIEEFERFNPSIQLDLNVRIKKHNRGIQGNPGIIRPGYQYVGGARVIQTHIGPTGPTGPQLRPSGTGGA